MDTKEEMIEEIEDIEMPEEIDTNDVVINQDISVAEETKSEEIPVIEEVEEKNGLENNEIDVNEPNEEEQLAEEEPKEKINELPSKSKAPAIIILSVLLVIDVAALVIYMIGIDKVISFIK